MGKDPKSKKVTKLAGAEEVDRPKSDPKNIWDQEFGWILKDGRPTEATKAYWAAMRKRPKQ